ncbi:MAG: hypothetical protein R6X02_30710 [Enhygromyxa sp.]
MDLRFSKAPAPATFGAFAFAALVALGATACSTDTVSSDGESGMTTTTMGATTDSTSGSTTVDETSETGMGSTGVDTDDEPDETTATSASFYAGPDVDFGSASECDPFMQDCPEGEKCVPYASSGGTWDANKCVPVLGDKAAGDPCVYGGTVEATDDCGPDSHCWNVREIDGEQVGECTEFCQGTPDAPECAPGTSCLLTANGSINLCLASCDPLAQDCAPGLGCYWANGNFHCVVTSQDVPLGEPCGFINDCSAGSICTSGETLPDCANWCCTSFCELGSNEPCPQLETECVPFFPEGEAPPEHVDLGVCVLPDP